MYCKYFISYSYPSYICKSLSLPKALTGIHRSFVFKNNSISCSCQTNDCYINFKYYEIDKQIVSYFLPCVHHSLRGAEEETHPFPLLTVVPPVHPATPPGSRYPSRIDPSNAADALRPFYLIFEFHNSCTVKLAVSSDQS